MSASVWVRYAAGLGRGACPAVRRLPTSPSSSPFCFFGACRLVRHPVVAQRPLTADILRVWHDVPVAGRHFATVVPVFVRRRDQLPAPTLVHFPTRAKNVE